MDTCHLFSSALFLACLASNTICLSVSDDDDTSKSDSARGCADNKDQSKASSDKDTKETRTEKTKSDKDKEIKES